LPGSPYDRKLDEPVHPPGALRADRINLAWTASAPRLALGFSLLTILLGPVAAYNVAAPAMAALSAHSSRPRVAEVRRAHEHIQVLLAKLTRP
jgi:hypothetical protein